MKFSIPPVGSVSPCLRVFIESLISEVEDVNVAGLFEPEKDLIGSRFVSIHEGKPGSRASQPIS
jgi:hypothetical protein